MAAKREASSKAWCFTINNPEEDDNPLLWAREHVDYLYAAPELADSGTPHWQGYLVLKKPSRLSGLKKLHEGAHWEKAKGTAQQNKTYCSKQQIPDVPTFVELGALPATPGEREKNRWKHIHDLARTNAKEEFVSLFPSESFYSMTKFEALADHYRKPPATLDGPLEHLYFYGEPGTGKSSEARRRYPGLYVKDCSEWWPGYNDEEVVLVEDIDPGVVKKITPATLKIWTDRYPFYANNKGRNARMIRPKLFIFTSNFTLNELCYGENHLEDAMNRRLKIVLFDNTLLDAAAKLRKKGTPREEILFKPHDVNG